MNLDEIKLMYEYNYWANKRILAACVHVSQQQYEADTPFGNLRATMTHLLDGEMLWREGFQRYVRNQTPEDWSDHVELMPSDVPTVGILKARWEPEEQAMRAYLNALTEDDLNGLVRYLVPGNIVRDRVLWHCLWHLVNHGTQHRSEAAVMLTSCGQSPGGMDFTLFLNEHFNLPTNP